MESVFEQMLRGEKSACFLVQNEEQAAILEPNPCAPGHTVIFPKKRTDAVLDLTPEALARLMLFAQSVGHALRAALPCDKIALVAYGLKVRHAHVHLIPVRGTAGEIALDKPRPAADPVVLQDLARQIQAHL